MFLNGCMQLHVLQVYLHHLVISGSWREDQRHWGDNTKKYWKVILHVRLKIVWMDSSVAIPLRLLTNVCLGSKSSCLQDRTGEKKSGKISYLVIIFYYFVLVSGFWVLIQANFCQTIPVLCSVCHNGCISAVSLEKIKFSRKCYIFKKFY